MKVLPRTEFGNPILRKKAKKVTLKTLKTKKFKNLVKQMIYTMKRSNGVGLAAPQVGESIQLAVMEVGPTKNRPKLKKRGPIVVVNPKIVKYSKEQIPDWEACLSFKYIYGKTPRSKSITVQYYNEKGKKITEEATGFWARIFQHEIDHLNGVVFIDQMKDMKTIMTQQEFRKRVLKSK